MDIFSKSDDNILYFGWMVSTYFSMQEIFMHLFFCQWFVTCLGKTSFDLVNPLFCNSEHALCMLYFTQCCFLKHYLLACEKILILLILLVSSDLSPEDKVLKTSLKNFRCVRPSVALMK